MAAHSSKPHGYDSRLDALEVAREEAPYRDENRASKQRDPEAVLATGLCSLSVACDWIEAGTPEDLANALELVGYVMDDIEDLVGGGP